MTDALLLSSFRSEGASSTIVPRASIERSERTSDWKEILRAFRFHERGIDDVQRLTDDWIMTMALPDADVSTGRVHAEYWSRRRLKRLIDHLSTFRRVAGYSSQMITDHKPKVNGGPLIIVRHADHEFMIDGRRRANIWKHEEGCYRVLVITLGP